MISPELEQILKQINDTFNNPSVKKILPIIESDYKNHRARILSYLSTGTEDNWMCFKESDL